MQVDISMPHEKQKEDQTRDIIYANDFFVSLLFIIFTRHKISHKISN